MSITQALDVLAYLEQQGHEQRPGAINGRLESLRGSALEFRNLTNYIATSLRETGGIQTATTVSIRAAL